VAGYARMKPADLRKEASEAESMARLVSYGRQGVAHRQGCRVAASSGQTGNSVLRANWSRWPLDSRWDGI